MRSSDKVSLYPIENSNPLFSTEPAFTTGPDEPGAVTPNIPDTWGLNNKSSVVLLK